MTAPFEVEFEDEDKVIRLENSHLSRGRCACGALTLFAPGRRPRCGNCIRRDSSVAEEPLPLKTRLAPLGQGYPPAPALADEAFPAPEVTSRDCWDGCDAPAVVEKLAQRARAAGWRVKAQRSRGCFPNAATGRPSAPRDLYALRFRKGGAAAYAVRDGDAWSSVMLWSNERTWFPLASVTDLGEYLAAGGEVSDEWFDEIRYRDVRAAQRKRERSNCDKGLHLTKHLSKLPFTGPWREDPSGWWCALCKHGWRTAGEPWKKPKRGKTEAL